MQFVSHAAIPLPAASLSYATSPLLHSGRVLVRCAGPRSYVVAPHRLAPRDLTLGEGFNTQVITLWCFYIVGREILTLGEGFNTQVITLWCFYIVGREMLTTWGRVSTLR